MSTVVIRCPQGTDELGQPELFTSDVVGIAKADTVNHLTSHGVPRIGTEVRPGLILIGKVGSKQTGSDFKEMTDLQLLVTEPNELQRYWHAIFYDGSVYAPPGCFGKVVDAYFEIDGNKRRLLEFEEPRGMAVVEIENP